MVRTRLESRRLALEPAWVARLAHRRPRTWDERVFPAAPERQFQTFISFLPPFPLIRTRIGDSTGTDFA